MNEFKTLMDFLDRFAPEVVGHAVQEPPPAEMQVRLEQFVSGNCSKDEIETMCEALRTQPQWIDWVAQRVKDQRRVVGQNGDSLTHA